MKEETSHYTKFNNEFLDDLKEMLTQSPDEMLHENGIMITSGPYEIHIHAIYPSGENETASLIQLIDQRPELLSKSLKAGNFREFIEHTRELAIWLHQRGFTLGLGASTFWAKLRLYWFKLITRKVE